MNLEEQKHFREYETNIELKEAKAKLQKITSEAERLNELYCQCKTKLNEIKNSFKTIEDRDNDFKHNKNGEQYKTHIKSLLLWSDVDEYKTKTKEEKRKNKKRLGLLHFDEWTIEECKEYIDFNNDSENKFNEPNGNEFVHIA